MEIEKLNPIQYGIIEQISIAIVALDGNVSLLAPLNSWGDTLPEEDVFNLLVEYNQSK